MAELPRLSELLICAIEATRFAGHHALANIRRRQEVVSRARHDVKLQLDVECQAEAESFIRRQYPHHVIMGEESQASPQAGNQLEWVIDPIDGTVNFSHGLPFWCCSIAVRHQGKSLAGAVYAPELDELYTASLEAPAQCNGRPIRVSSCNTLADAIVLTGMDKTNDPNIPPLELFRTIAAHTQKARILGSAALDMCHVAAGRAEAYFESGVYVWDVAAAGLICEQAGGQSELLRPLPDHRIQFLSTNRLIHAPLKDLIEGVMVRASR